MASKVITMVTGFPSLIESHGGSRVPFTLALKLVSNRFGLQLP